MVRVLALLNLDVTQMYVNTLSFENYFLAPSGAQGDTLSVCLSVLHKFV